MHSALQCKLWEHSCRPRSCDPLIEESRTFFTLRGFIPGRRYSSLCRKLLKLEESGQETSCPKLLAPALKTRPNYREKRNKEVTTYNSHARRVGFGILVSEWHGEAKTIAASS